MTNLTILPDDILHALLSQLSAEKSTLRSLALAHPRFASLIPTYLLKSLELYIRNVDDTFSKSFQLLLRTINEQPRLSNLIRNLTLHLYSYWAPNLDDDQLPILANALLSRLQNLHSLSLQAGGPGEVYTPLTFLASNPLTHLHTLSICDPETTLSDIFTYITSLPSLHTLHITALDFTSSPPPSFTIPPSSRKSFQLRTLCLPTVHLPPPSLHALLLLLLLLPRALDKLHCLIPGLAAREDFGICSHGAKMLQPLNVPDVAACLQPARESLVELCVLRHAGMDLWPEGRDGGGARLDLSGYGRLRVLKVASELVFGGEGDAERRGLWRLLPGSLEVLDIDFGFESQILPFTSAEHTILSPFSSPTSQSYKDNLKHKPTWLHEIAEHTHDSLPALRKVTLKERWKHPQGFAHVPVQWTLPEHLDELFQRSGVEVEVWMRKPRDYGNVEEE